MLFLVLDTTEDVNVAKKLYVKYSKFMFKVAYSVLNDHYKAEDAVQQAFIRIIKNLNKIDIEQEKRTRNFIGLITKNVSIDMYNRDKNEALPIDDDTLIESSVDISSIIIITKETYKRIKKQINLLKPIYQEVIYMKFEQNFNVNEISEILNISPETVRKRIERGRKKIINALNKEDN